MKKYFKDWTLFEKIWLLISTLTILGLSLYWQDSLIGIIASLTGVWCVVLVAKGKISNYYVGIINVVAYAYVAYQWAYYGEVMLNILYYLPAQFIGIYYWKRNTTDDSQLKVLSMSNKERIKWIVISVLGVIGYGLFLKYINGSLPFIDSLSTVLSVIAMILMIKRYPEQWVIWMVVNVTSIVLWVATLLQGGNDISILIMWCCYLINSIYGFQNWIKMSKRQQGGI